MYNSYNSIKVCNNNSALIVTTISILALISAPSRKNHVHHSDCGENLLHQFFYAMRSMTVKKDMLQGFLFMAANAPYQTGNH